MKKSKYKPGDVVLVKSRAGDAIPNIHVRLIKRKTILPRKGKRVGIRMTMDWPGYTGWKATPVFQEEIDILKKEWSIPLSEPGVDITFVYEDDIIKKPRKPIPNIKMSSKKGNKKTILRKNKTR